MEKEIKATVMGFRVQGLGGVWFGVVGLWLRV